MGLLFETTKETDIDNREAIRLPNESANFAIKVIDERIKERQSGNKKGFFNIPEIRDVVRKPLADLVSICGRPRNGKSFIAKKLILEETLDLYKKPPSNQCTICITWEEPAEILAMNWMANLSGISTTKMIRGDISRHEFDKLNNVIALKVGSYPIYIIGGSMKRLEDGSRRVPDLNLAGVEKALYWLMNKQGKDPVMVSGDYIQRVSNSRNLDMPTHVMNVNNWFKNLTILGFPVIQVTQAKQEIEKKDLPMPDLEDSEWSGSVGQASDFFIGTMMPKTKYPKAGSIIDKYHIYERFPVTDDLLFVKISKQKYDRDGFIFPLQVRPDLLKWRMADFYYDSSYARDMQHSKPALEVWY